MAVTKDKRRNDFFLKEIEYDTCQISSKSRLGISNIVSSSKSNNIIVFVSTLYHQLLF